MTNRAVMQQALECIERLNMRGFILADFEDEVESAINALREALTQPEQEPSQWRDMVVVSLVREGINKHKARELADHFAAHPEQEPWRESASDYERGVIDGRQMQAQSSVDKAVNAMAQRPWQGLTDEEVQFYIKKHSKLVNAGYDKVTDTNLVAKTFDSTGFYKEVLAVLKERNG